MAAQHPPKPRVIGIVGATASGKTGLSLRLAAALEGEIVCLDSMQVYRDMDIGTAKPTPAQRAAVAHHMLDIVSPAQPFSVADYVPRAHAVIEDIHSRGRVPLLVGGTGMYLRGLTLPQDYGGLPGDSALRAALHAQAQRQGVQALYAQLSAIDPATAARLHPNDIRRVVRALEIYQLTGVPMSAHRAPTNADSPYDFRLFAIDWPRGELHARINRRVDDMVQSGLADEVRALMAQGVPPDAQSMQGLGYKELLPALEGKITLDDAIERVKAGTRNYARRQLTWFRADARVTWLSHTALPQAEDSILRMLKETV